MINAKVEGVDAVKRRIQRAIDSTDDAVITGLLETGEKATNAMESRILDAITVTGLMREEHYFGLGISGRVETAAMINSLRQSNKDPGELGYSLKGDIVYKVGYVKNPPDYTEAQETNSYTISGVLDAISEAWEVLADDLEYTVIKALNDMIEQTETRDYQAPELLVTPWGENEYL